MLFRSALIVWFLAAVSFSLGGEPLPGTQLLTAEGDLSAKMVEGIHNWLALARERVDKDHLLRWISDAAIAPAELRAELSEMIGAVDERRSGELVVQMDPAEWNTAIPAGSYAVRKVIWPVFDGVHGEGLILQPSEPAKAAVIALPDADQTPEQ